MSTSVTYDPFESDWRACLEAHLRHVIVTGDTINEVSLLSVLKMAGMTDQDIARVRYEITGEQSAEEAIDEPSMEASAEVTMETVAVAEPVPTSADVPPAEVVAEQAVSVEVEEVPTLSVLQTAKKDAPTPASTQLSLF